MPKTSSASRDQAISLIVPLARVCLRTRYCSGIDRFGQRFQRRGAVQGAVRPVLIVVGSCDTRSRVVSELVEEVRLMLET